MDTEVFVTPGLGDNSYLVISGDEAALIDPQRDAWRFLAVAAARRARLRYIFETHVHNDYLSGAREAQAATGAAIVAPATGGYEFPHTPAGEGDRFALGALTFTAMATPGHTFEHTAWLATEEGAPHPSGVFTGGSLIVGSAGRTDLLGPAQVEALTRAQHRTLQRLAALPPQTTVFPTHGAGSFCASTAPALRRTTTIGSEREGNPALAARTLEEFMTRQLTGLMAYPAYYPHMAPINRRGPAVLRETPPPRALAPEALEQLALDGAWVVDGRDRVSFAQAHLPGSINIELEASFGTYVGWLTPFNAPLALVLPEPADASWREALTQLVRIGYERVHGYLEGGVARWQQRGRPARSYGIVTIDEVCEAAVSSRPMRLLDVRQPLEWSMTHAPQGLRVFVGDLPAQVTSIPRDRELWVMCASGHRAAMAASLLDRERIPVKLLAQGGVADWLARCDPRRMAEEPVQG